MRNHLQEYLSESADLMAMYAASPRALFDTPARSGAWGAGIADGIRNYQSRIGATSTFEGTESVIVTGQQPGIFTGPLYTVTKAVTTLNLARKISEQSGASCVPLFWIGGDDHDFEEARTTYILSKKHEPVELTYTPTQEVTGFPSYRLPLEGQIKELIEIAANESQGSEHRTEITELLYETLDASESLAEWTARLMAKLFAQTPLVFFAPHISASREAAAAIMRKDIEEPLRSTVLLNEAGACLERMELAPQVVKGEKECNFFLEVSGVREKVLYERDRFTLRGGEISYDVGELLGVLDQEPERFSPNVALRCIVQQHLFPCAAYVAGPGELAYWAQLKPLFEHFSLEMPIVYPRAQCTLTTMKLKKLVAKLGLEESNLLRAERAVLDEAMISSSKDPAVQLLRDEGAKLERVFSELVEGLRGRHEIAATMTERLAKDFAERLVKIERTVLQGDEAKVEAVRKQVRRIVNSLAPHRKPQERVYCVFSFLFEHGLGLIERLIDELDVESFRMTEIEL